MRLAIIVKTSAKRCKFATNWAALQVKTMKIYSMQFNARRNHVWTARNALGMRKDAKMVSDNANFLNPHF